MDIFFFFNFWILYVVMLFVEVGEVVDDVYDVILSLGFENCLGMVLVII